MVFGSSLVVSDIHGNSEALNAVVGKYFTSDVKNVFCLGDIFNCGPDINGTFNILRELESNVLNRNGNFSLICGNNDYVALMLYANRLTPYVKQWASTDSLSIALIKHQLGIISEKNFNWFKAKVEDLSVSGSKALVNLDTRTIHEIGFKVNSEVNAKFKFAAVYSNPQHDLVGLKFDEVLQFDNGKKVQLSHGGPGPLFATYLGGYTPEDLQYFFKEVPDLLIIGHTHVPKQVEWRVRGKDVLIFNVGSVGFPRNREPGAFAGLIDENFLTHSVNSEYDIEKVLAGMQQINDDYIQSKVQVFHKWLKHGEDSEYTY